MTVTLVMMGVSGAGKTTVGQAVARALGWPFDEGDAFHPPANVEKMRAGIALTDGDRAPWLQSLARLISQREQAGQNFVLTCSALRRAYRDVLRAGHPSVRFCQLLVPGEVLQQRVASRTGHFMPASLLPGQLALLEPLQPDEPGFSVEPGPLDEMVARVLAASA